MSILSNIHAQIKIRIYTAAAYIIRLLHSIQTWSAHLLGKLPI